jgi:hypothetical protein
VSAAVTLADVAHVWVPVAVGGAVPVLEIDRVRVVVAFAAEESLPEELPPGCSEWQHLPVDQLALVVPEDAALYLEPGGETIDLRGPRECATALVRAAARYQQNEIDMEDLLRVFRRSVVYCRAAERPGFVAHGGMIPVFSSLVTITRVLGDTSWFAATGGEVLDQVRDGYELFLDPGTPHATGILRR